MTSLTIAADATVAVAVGHALTTTMDGVETQIVLVKTPNTVTYAKHISSGRTTVCKHHNSWRKPPPGSHEVGPVRTQRQRLAR